MNIIIKINNKMKNILKISCVLLLFLNCLVTKAQTTKEQLTGTWSFDLNSSIANMDESAKAILLKVPVAHGKLESSYKNRQIAFNANDSYLFHLSDGREETGTWTINNMGGTVITLTNSQGHVQNLTVIMLSSTALVLKPDTEGKGKPMFSKWYFIKS